MRSSAWSDVSAAIEAAPYPVSVLSGAGAGAAEQLDRLGVTTRSWLGAVVANSGGLLVDHGWLRVLGSGAGALPGVVDVLELDDRGLTVGHDVLGGRFVWTQNAEGRPTVHYFGPEDLEWYDTAEGYGDWLELMLGGAVTEFYEAVRWPGWEQEVAAVPLDQGLHTWPPPWSAEGKDLATASRRAISFRELVSFHEDMARQLDGAR